MPLVRSKERDRDEMAVCVEPREYVLGLREFEHFVYRTQAEGVSSGPGDLDLVVYGLRKYCRLALKGSPTVLLLLFASGEHLVATTPLGERLQALAPAFVSRRAGRAFLGYLDAQRRGLLGERHAPPHGSWLSTGFSSQPTRRLGPRGRSRRHAASRPENGRHACPWLPLRTMKQRSFACRQVVARQAHPRGFTPTDLRCCG